MSYQQSDEEQIELLKRVWKKYGQPFLVAGAITFSVFFGYKYWIKAAYDRATEASSLYQSIIDVIGVSPQHGLISASTLTDEQRTTLSYVVNRLQSDYDDTRYAVLATMLQAKQQVQENDLQGARDSFEWVLMQRTTEEIESIARIRLARVLLSQSNNNSQEALKILEKVTLKAYQVALESVRGDLYLALGNYQRAKLSYQIAMNAAQINGDVRPLLKWKFDDLNSVSTQEVLMSEDFN